MGLGLGVRDLCVYGAAHGVTAGVPVSMWVLVKINWDEPLGR